MPFIGNIYCIVSNSKVLWITLHKIALKCILRQVVSLAGVQCALFTVFVYTEAVCSNLPPSQSSQNTQCSGNRSPSYSVTTPSTFLLLIWFNHVSTSLSPIRRFWRENVSNWKLAELIYLDRWTWTVSCLAAQKDGSPAVFNDVAILSTLSLVCHFWHHHIFVGSQAFHVVTFCPSKTFSAISCLMMF